MTELFNKSIPDFINACSQCKWMPRIFIPSPEWSMVGEVPVVDASCLTRKQMSDVNIISIMQLSKHDLYKSIRHCNYPGLACFRFCGFVGESDKDRLIDFIKEAAENSGSPLIAASGSCDNRSKYVYKSIP